MTMGKALMKGRKRCSGSVACQVVRAQKNIASATPTAVDITPPIMKPRQS